MEYTHLGRTGLRVSRLCLGTMNFGPETDEADSYAIMDRAHDARDQLLRHRQRLRLGRGRGRHRADHRPLVRPGRRPARAHRPRDQALRRHGRLAERRQALGAQHPSRVRRLAAAAADRLHRPLPDAPRRPARRRGTRSGRRWRSCAQQGKILYVGSSNFAGWHIARAQEAARRAALLGLVSEQSIYNLVERDASSSRCCRPRRRYGIGVIPWSPLHGGLLGGVLRKEREGGAPRTQRAGAQADASRSTAPASRRARPSAPSSARTRRRRRSPGCCTSPAVTAPIVGPRTIEQLDGALRALEIDARRRRARPRSTRSSPATAAPRPRPTPGEPPFPCDRAGPGGPPPGNRGRGPGSRLAQQTTEVAGDAASPSSRSPPSPGTSTVTWVPPAASDRSIAPASSAPVPAAGASKPRASGSRPSSPGAIGGSSRPHRARGGTSA